MVITVVVVVVVVVLLLPRDALCIVQSVVLGSHVVCLSVCDVADLLLRETARLWYISRPRHVLLRRMLH